MAAASIVLDEDRPLLVFGGPYSNLQATIEMWDKAERLGIPPTQVICTGDVVAYCAEPEETVSLIRDWGCHVIKGNCEESLARHAPDCGCGFDDGTACDRMSKGWYAFADQHVSENSRVWMRKLPSSLGFTLGGWQVRVIHGGVSKTRQFIFASTPATEKQAEFAKAGSDIIIGGHCGIPFMQEIGSRFWFNPGVIGMPANDGTPDGWYGLIVPGEKVLCFSIERLTYNAGAAAQKLRNVGSAAPYADALERGLWPSLDVLPPKERDLTASAISIKPLNFKYKNIPLKRLAQSSQLRQIQ